MDALLSVRQVQAHYRDAAPGPQGTYCVMPGASRTFLPMNRTLGMVLVMGLAACAAPPPPPAASRVELPAFRAPAVPLFVQTPYLHTWLCGDRLADEAPKLWNGQVKGMAGILRIDGKAYRFMGLPSSPLPAL